MNLIIDLGNTLSKIAIIERDRIVKTKSFQELTLEDLSNIFFQYPEVDNTILSSVINHNNELNIYLNKVTKNFIELNHETNLPIKNLYKTKETLGKDRVAAIVGAYSIYPDSNTLVIDSGTAITFDFINQKNEYLGGNISPGISMRFKALNSFTKKLPLLSKKEVFEFIGDNTEDAIISGVLNGIIFEVEGYINKFKCNHVDLKVILTGGDCFFFDKKLKNTIFAEPNLIFLGLNRILKHNVENI